MRRKLLIVACTTVALLAVTVATLPWWLGFVLSHAGASWGLTFARYERIGYARFALHGAEVRVAPVRVTLARFEADTPLVALWRRGEIAVGRWAVEVVNRDPPPAPIATARGWLPLRTQLQAVQQQLSRWAPRVTADAGEVRWTGAVLTCAALRWSDSGLTVSAFRWREAQADFTLTFPGDALRLTVRGTEGTATWESRGGRVIGDVRWWQQRADVTARFGVSGWLPTEATSRAEEWTVPGEKLRLGESYATVRGQGKIDWREKTLAWEVTATGDPLAGKTAPPLAVNLRGRGAGDTITVENLQATLPGIAVLLSEPVTFGHDGKVRQGAARLTLEVDLAQQPWFTARGLVRGEARLANVVGLTTAPAMEFQLTARDMAVANWVASSVTAKARLEWPRLQVSEGTLVGPSGETLAWRGGWDFVTKEIFDATVEGQIRPATFARWLPAEVTFESATLRLTAHGPTANLWHNGKIHADAVKFGALNPLALKAEWAGRGPLVEAFSIEATAGTTTLSAGGSLAAQGGRLSRLELAQGGTVQLSLVAPAEVRWSPTVTAEAIELTGPEGRVEVAGAWGTTGRARLALRNISSEWFREFGVLRGPAWQLTSLTAIGEWDRGPMTFSVACAGILNLGEGTAAAMVVSAQGDAAGLRIAELDVVEREKRVVRVTGNLPIRLRPGAVRWAEFEPDGALALSVTTEPSAEFWRQLTAMTGFELKEPAAQAQIAGTWAQPTVTAQVKVARLAADAARFTWPVPTIEAVELSLASDAREVRLVRLAATVEGQAVTASARLPLGADGWSGLVSTPRLWARRDWEVTCEVPGADLAALARILPEFVAPRGRLEATVSYRDGALGGAIRLRDVTTRRVGTLAALQQINADVALAGRKADLSGTAHYGGEQLTLRGTVELPVSATPAAPPAGEESGGLLGGLTFDVALKGENLPLVRQTGVLVRGDVELKLSSPASGPPLLAGVVRLRDSLLFSDVRALLPRGVRTRAQTPPYFAVELAPYRTWQLDVAVQGARFLKLRTALFNGIVSARFKLGGTLGVPSLRGEATIDEGAVKLPFATFVVQEGRVSLTPEQSSEPQVWLVGTVRRLNYDLRMEASGSAAAPALVFTSSPPLDSGQVLLMVMAGEPPHSETVYSDRQRVAQLGAFFGQSLFASLAGDSAATERLSLSSGESISRQGRETYEIEYRLSERWALVGEYDEFDDFNAGLKWRVFSRGGQREEPKQP